MGEHHRPATCSNCGAVGPKRGVQAIVRGWQRGPGLRPNWRCPDHHVIAAPVEPVTLSPSTQHVLTVAGKVMARLG